jgi:aspartate racemase
MNQIEKIISDIIYKELVKGEIPDKSKKQYLEIIDKLIKQHQIEGLILGCTEIPLLIKPNDLPIPAFNTTEIHANETVNFALG